VTVVVVAAALPWAAERFTVDDLLDLLEPPAFHRDAACKEAPAEVSWFPVKGQTAAPAKAVCGRCLVAPECLAWSLAQGEGLAGIWAGLSDRERRRLRGGG
jgi:WhiB family transcriptional regulator, redox-sensing transcriptional regulator